MRPPIPLPASLQDRVFSRAEARALGVTDARLRARDITRIAHATYCHRPLTSLSGPAPNESGPAHDVVPQFHREELLRALCRRNPAAWISHVTAAQVYGLLLPARFTGDPRLHLSAVHRAYGAEADPGIRLHRAMAIPETRPCLREIVLSSPARLFADLAACLNLSELVVIGDQLVRFPRPGLEARDEPWTALDALRQSVCAEGQGRIGAPKARQALEKVRVGADSPPETRMRLALQDRGLPEPELQIALDPSDPWSPVGDAGYRKQQLVLQYDGAHHFDAGQQARDQRRNASFEAEGWSVVIANRVDLAEGFQSVVRRVKRLLARER